MDFVYLKDSQDNKKEILKILRNVGRQKCSNIPKEFIPLRLAVIERGRFNPTPWVQCLHRDNLRMSEEKGCIISLEGISIF